MSVDLSNRVAVVTGGASGIGRAIAVLLAEHGARVFIGEFDSLAENAEPFKRLGITEVPCDVRVESQVRYLIETAAGNNGIDILVNNAGVGLVKPITEVTEEEWDTVLDTNLKGAFLCSKHAIPQMIKRGGGSIVNIASNAGLLPRSHDPVYSISKGALIALTRSLALSHAPDRIRVNAVCPGPVGDTRMMDQGLDAEPDRDAAVAELIAASPLAAAHNRMTDPREIAESALYLVSDAALMVSGTSIAIDGGKALGVPPKRT